MITVEGNASFLSKKKTPQICLDSSLKMFSLEMASIIFALRGIQNPMIPATPLPLYPIIAILPTHY
jgi:hypothetical protein